MQHIITIGGQLVRRPGSTLTEAAAEFAAQHTGNVIFICPNYAVVATHSRKEGFTVYPSQDSKEVTIWMK